MAKNDSVKDLLVDVADAIRAKKGTTDLINPQDFSEEIASIEVGGSGGSGGGEGAESSKRYYRIEMQKNTDVYVQFYGTNMKADMGGGEVAVVGIGLIFADGIPSTNWKAVAIDIDTPTYSPTGDGIISFREQVEKYGGNVDDLADVGLISITKEEFYNLG